MELQQWLAALAAELEVADVDVSEDTITSLLDLTREVAHTVERVAGPLTTFLVGVAVGRGAALPPTVEAALARLDGPAPATAG